MRASAARLGGVFADAHVFHAHRTVTKPPLPYPGEDAEREAVRISALPAHESQTWLLLEYCDRPCLQVTHPHDSMAVAVLAPRDSSCKVRSSC